MRRLGLGAVCLSACAQAPTTCACPADVDGWGMLVEDRCLCLPKGEPTPDPPASVELLLGPEDVVDWAAVDGLLAEGTVHVRFTGVRDKDLEVYRTDAGPHRLILDGQGQTVVPAVTTRFEDVPRHRVTVRGFEITGGDDKGVYWRAGDDIVVEDNHVHHTRGTPAISFEYSNRTGLPSSRVVVRNNHVHDQPGECIYVGGSEGEDLDAHAEVVVEHNLVHDCANPLHSRHDGINIKDRIGHVQLNHNVVARTDWGIEVASPGDYDDNVVIDTVREGFQVVDAFQPFRDLRFHRNQVFDAGHHGFQLITSTATTGLVVHGLAVHGAKQAGFYLGGDEASELTMAQVEVQGAAVPLDGWGANDRTEVTSCTVPEAAAVNARAFAGVRCERSALPQRVPAGPDGVFFTGDEALPWSALTAK